MVSAAQCRAARALLKWTVQHLAARAGVGRSTVTRLEGGEATILPAQRAAIRVALEAAGVQFIGGDGVRLPAPAPAPGFGESTAFDVA